jgi:hypothetical protein
MITGETKAKLIKNLLVDIQMKESTQMQECYLRVAIEEWKRPCLEQITLSETSTDDECNNV